MKRSPVLWFEGIGKCYYARMGRRMPKRGEFYLSGTNENGLPDGYRAPNDLSIVFEVVIPTHHARSVQRYVRGQLVTVPPLPPRKP